MDEILKPEYLEYVYGDNWPEFALDEYDLVLDWTG